jgi:hypothetical protein
MFGIFAEVLAGLGERWRREPPYPGDVSFDEAELDAGATLRPVVGVLSDFVLGRLSGVRVWSGACGGWNVFVEARKFNGIEWLLPALDVGLEVVGGGPIDVSF